MQRLSRLHDNMLPARQGIKLLGRDLCCGLRQKSAAVVADYLHPDRRVPEYLRIFGADGHKTDVDIYLPCQHFNVVYPREKLDDFDLRFLGQQPQRDQEKGEGKDDDKKRFEKRDEPSEEAAVQYNAVSPVYEENADDHQSDRQPDHQKQTDVGMEIQIGLRLVRDDVEHKVAALIRDAQKCHRDDRDKQKQPFPRRAIIIPLPDAQRGKDTKCQPH